jgi:hypothetical protein
MKLGSSRKPISLAMVPSARPRNDKTMLSALSQNATRPDRLAHHFVLWSDVRATRAPPIQRVSARDSTSSLRMSSLVRISGLKSDIARGPEGANCGHRGLANQPIARHRKVVLPWGELEMRWGHKPHRGANPRAGVLSERAAKRRGDRRHPLVARAKESQGWGLVKVTHVMGDRRDHTD